MKIRTIKIPLYCGELVLIKTNDFTEVNKIYDTNADNSYEAFCFEDEAKGKFYAVFNPDKIDFAVVAHECVHLNNLIFSYNHIRLDLYNDEPQAYLTGWIFEEIEKFLKGVVEKGKQFDLQAIKEEYQEVSINGKGMQESINNSYNRMKFK